MNIESFFPGRLRVSSPLFARQDNLDTVREYVQSLKGIKDFSANPQTGSITVVYDPAIITMPMLLDAKAELERLEMEAN